MSQVPKARKLPSWMLSQSNAATENKSLESPVLKFIGKINYCSTVGDCAIACEALIQDAATGELMLGFDMEWPVTYGAGDNRTALIQICPSEAVCHLFHISCMRNLPVAFVELLHHPNVKLAGLNIACDLWKLSRDFNVIVKPLIETRIVELSDFANKVLRSGQNWSLERLVLHTLKKRIPKDDSVRKSNWKAEHLSEAQKKYAALDAYVSVLGFLVVIQAFEGSGGYIMSGIAKILQVGHMSYSRALRLQQLVAMRHFEAPNEVCDTLILVEHSPVYTIGLRTKGYTLELEDKLKSLGADFYRTNRGGLITFHGPGQLVVYPILNLKHYKPSVRWYVACLEQTVIDMCARLGLGASTSPHTGVWVGDNKLCAIGIHATRYVTTHGLALNCNTDMKWFGHIIPCGIEGKGVTSLSQETGREWSIQETVPLFLDSFSKVFECMLCNYPSGEAEKLLKIV